MVEKKGTGIGIALSILAFFLGIAGFVMLFVVGESTNNALMAFLSVSLGFAFFSGIFSWFAPRFWWAIALAMSTPVVLISIIGAWSGLIMLIGAAIVLAVTFGAGYLGKWLRERKMSTQSPPAP